MHAKKERVGETERERERESDRKKFLLPCHPCDKRYVKMKVERRKKESKSQEVFRDRDEH